MGAQNASYTAKEPRKETSLLSSQFVYIGVLSDDFAAVDFREDYANLSLPKEQNSRGKRNGKTNEEKGSHGGKAATDPQAV